MPNMINKMIVRQLSSAFGEADGMVIVSMEGLTVQESEAVRNSLAEQGVRLRLVRNRLARLALEENGIEAPEDMLAGNVAIAWGGSEDAIHAAKVLSRSPSAKQGKIAFRGGLLEGSLLGSAEAAQMAELPSKDELRAMLLGALSGPARGLVGMLAAPGASLARVLQARIDEGAEAAD